MPVTAPDRWETTLSPSGSRSSWPGGPRWTLVAGDGGRGSAGSARAGGCGTRGRGVVRSAQAPPERAPLSSVSGRTPTRTSGGPARRSSGTPRNSAYRGGRARTSSRSVRPSCSRWCWVVVGAGVSVVAAGVVAVTGPAFAAVAVWVRRSFRPRAWASSCPRDGILGPGHFSLMLYGPGRELPSGCGQEHLGVALACPAVLAGWVVALLPA